jgi:arylsulfatase A-like enzyme
MLQSAGYAAAHFGKWHVGRTSPATHGFTENDGANNNGGPENVQDPATLQTPKNGTAAAEFIKTQIAAKKPFYVQISQYASKADVDQERMDTVLSELQKVLKEAGQADNTYILYTTDHGTPGRNSPFKAGKGFLTEGGIRVPFVISGPGIPKGKFIATPVSTMDIFPTIAELAGVKTLPKDLDGGSLASILKLGSAGKVAGRGDDMFFHFPHYDMNNGGPCSAIVSGDYKLIRYYEDDHSELYNVVTDPSERRNLLMDKPDVAKDLTSKLEAYLKSINAGMPTKNPNFDPNKPSDGAPQRGRKGGFGPADGEPGQGGGGQGGGRGGRGGGGGQGGGRGGRGGGGNGGGNNGGGNGGW